MTKRSDDCNEEFLNLFDLESNKIVIVILAHAVLVELDLEEWRRFHLRDKCGKRSYVSLRAITTALCILRLSASFFVKDTYST